MASDTILCPFCHYEVRPSAEGLCPSCGCSTNPFEPPISTSSSAPPITTLPTPAGFWIRGLAVIVDGLVFLPVVALSFAAMSTRSMTLAVLSAVPSLFYKPWMESRFGATLGKMACGLKVIDDRGEKLSLGGAYVRSSPMLASSLLSLAGLIWLYSQPAFQSAAGLLEIAPIMEQSPLALFERGMSFLVAIDCVVAAFAHRKRAIHDMLAGSYCVYDPARQ